MTYFTSSHTSVVDDTSSRAMLDCKLPENGGIALLLLCEVLVKTKDSPNILRKCEADRKAPYEAAESNAIAVLARGTVSIPKWKPVSGVNEELDGVMMVSSFFNAGQILISDTPAARSQPPSKTHTSPEI